MKTSSEILSKEFSFAKVLGQQLPVLHTCFAIAFITILEQITGSSN